jgi:hypothetical protein
MAQPFLTPALSVPLPLRFVTPQRGRLEASRPRRGSAPNPARSDSGTGLWMERLVASLFLMRRVLGKKRVIGESSKSQ